MIVEEDMLQDAEDLSRTIDSDDNDSVENESFKEISRNIHSHIKSGYSSYTEIMKNSPYSSFIGSNIGYDEDMSAFPHENGSCEDTNFPGMHMEKDPGSVFFEGLPKSRSQSPVISYRKGKWRLHCKIVLSNCLQVTGDASKLCLLFSYFYKFIYGRKHTRCMSSTLFMSILNIFYM